MQIILEERRLTLLQTLHQMNARRLNSRLLAGALAALAVPGSVAEVEHDLRFLQDAQCVVLESLGPFLIAELLERGEQVATGELRVAGVKRASARG